MIEFPSLADAAPLLGQEVVIQLQRNPTVNAVGVLLELSYDGEARYRRPDGVVARCWPVLALGRRHETGG